MYVFWIFTYINDFKYVLFDADEKIEREKERQREDREMKRESERSGGERERELAK